MRLALSVFLTLLPAVAAADDAAKPDLSKAVLLPQKADAARRAGVDNQEIQEALGAAKEGGLSAAEAGDVLDAAAVDAPTDAGRGLGPAVRDAVKSGKRGQELAAEIKRLRSERMATDGKGADDHGHGHGHDHGKGHGDGHEHGNGDGHDHGKGDGHDHGKGDGHDHGKGDGHDHGKGDGHDHGKGDGPAQGGKSKGEADAAHGGGKGGKPARPESGDSAEGKGKTKPAPSSTDGGKTKPAPKN